MTRVTNRSDIYVCDCCYDPKLMRWEEYTGAHFFHVGACFMCGSNEVTHWFCSPRHIVKTLILKIRAMQAD